MSTFNFPKSLKKKKFLVTGANGQLAREFIATFKKSKINFRAFDKAALNIAQASYVDEIIGEFKPDIVLNCAAYNNVNKAETDYQTALNVNAKGVGYLARSCRKHKAFLVHYGTDFIFDGLKKDYYVEKDKPNPPNRYGRTKLLGEIELKKFTKDFLLLRVSWVFGHSPNSFLWKLDELVKTQAKLHMTTDFVSIPTYTKDIVEYTLKLLNVKAAGTYHVASSSYATKYELARYYLKIRGFKNIVIPVPSSYFPKDAKRPFFAPLSTQKLQRKLKIKIPDWQDAINRYCQRNT